MFKQDSLCGGVTRKLGIGAGMRRAWCGGLIMGWLLLLAAPVQATEADERYIKIYTTIQQADTLSKAGETEKAKAKYAEADKALRELKQRYPNWNPKLVTMRQNYLADQQAKLSRPALEPEPATTVAPRPSSDQPQIKLISAGVEPLEAYRLQAQSGSQQKIKVSVQMNMNMGMADVPGETVKVPPMQMTATVTTKAVSDNQEVTYEAVIDEVSVGKDSGAPAMMVEALEQQLGGVKGAVVTGKMTDRYYTKQTEGRLRAGADVGAKESLEQLKASFASPGLILPEAPIGVGAKWEMRTRRKENNINVDLVITHELVSAEEGRLNIKSVTTRSASNQKISNPMMPAVKVDMTKLTGTTTEQLTIDLTKLQPVIQTTEERSEITMALNQGGQRQTMTMKTETHSKMESE